MRVISGKFGKRLLRPPRKIGARPTQDQVKEGLFNILQHSRELDNIRVLDLFAGTGSVSFEFASRGASSVIAVDTDPVAVQFIERTAEALGAEVHVIKMDVLRYLKKASPPFNVIFADPPYSYQQYEELTDLILKQGLLEPSGTLIIEHSKENTPPDQETLKERRQYGKTVLSFYSAS